jgi:hypothetical protein
LTFSLTTRTPSASTVTVRAASRRAPRRSKLADAEQQEELVRWGRDAVARIEGFYAGDDYQGADGVKFTFQTDGGHDQRQAIVIGE